MKFTSEIHRVLYLKKPRFFILHVWPNVGFVASLQYWQVSVCFNWSAIAVTGQRFMKGQYLHGVQVG